ncbi:MAG: glycosyltransferase [Alphaproteobacteria bacterium]
MKKILHVTESLGGGVATALRGYVQSAPDHQHYLLAAKRDGTHDKMTWLQNLAGLEELPREFFPAIKRIRAVYKKIMPDLVHLHSSFAGGYGRLALLPRRKVIYTPHCFAFERCDISKTQKIIYRLAEHILSTRSYMIAATSPRELDLAELLAFTQDTMILPNAPHLSAAIKEQRENYRPGKKLKIVMVGRISPQKDPAFFLDTVIMAKERRLEADFIWLGGGDPTWEDKLRAAGVSVSGWLEQDEALRRMAACDIYFHTAAWESCPLSVLEAAALDMLMVCRDCPAIVSLPVSPTVSSPKVAVDTFLQLAQNRRLDDFKPINQIINTAYSEQMQADALSDLYDA